MVTTVSVDKIIHSMSATNKPAAAVKSGEEFVMVTSDPGISDAIFENDYSDRNYPKRILSITGPVYIEGAEPGDLIGVQIHKIDLNEQGKMWMGQWMGILMDEVEKPYLKKVQVRSGEVVFNEKIKIPISPMIGTIGVAPLEEVDCLYPGTYGGNMDCKLITENCQVYLPVFVPGALLAIGDVHAAMGDGEILGTGVEIGSRVTLTVNVIKQKTIKHPWVETEDLIAVVVTDPDMVEASKEATREIIQLLQDRLQLSFEEAYALAGQYGDLRICQVVNRIYTVRFEIKKDLFITNNYK